VRAQGARNRKAGDHSRQLLNRAGSKKQEKPWETGAFLLFARLSAILDQRRPSTSRRGVALVCVHRRDKRTEAYLLTVSHYSREPPARCQGRPFRDSTLTGAALPLRDGFQVRRSNSPAQRGSWWHKSERLKVFRASPHVSREARDHALHDRRLRRIQHASPLS